MKERTYDILIKIQEFILILLIVLECNSVYHSISIGISQTLLYIFAGNIAAFLLVFLWVKKDKSNIECIKGQKYLLLILFAFVMLFYGVNVVNTDSVGYLGYFLFFTDAMIILYTIYRRNGLTFRLIFKLEQVIVFICLVSLIMWIGSVFLELWGEGKDLYIQWTGGDYYTNYLNLFVRRYIAGDNSKNMGIFVEPPMFGLMVSFCIYTEFFLKKRMNPLIVVILTGAIVSSRAILGIMISLLAFFIKFLEMIRKRKYARVVTVALAFFTFAGLILLLMYKRKVGWGSFATHLDDFAATLKCWKDNAILGCGYGVREPIEAYMSEFRINNKGLSNSPGMVLAQGGLYLFIFYMVPFVLLMVNFFRGNRRLAFWGGGAFALWVVIVFPYRLFCFFILGLGYALIEIKENKPESATDSKKISISLTRINENLPDTNSFWDRDIIKLKAGVTAVSTILLIIFSIWGVIQVGNNGIVSATASTICLVTEIVFIILCIRKKVSISSKKQMAVQSVLWLLMIVAGSLYSVADSLYRAIGMRIQDNWWMSILAVIALYSTGIVMSDRDKEVNE